MPGFSEERKGTQSETPTGVYVLTKIHTPLPISPAVLFEKIGVLESVEADWRWNINSNPHLLRDGAIGLVR